MSGNIVVVTESGTVVVTTAQIDVVTVVSQGEQGIPGPNTIGGYTIAASGAVEGDTLEFVGGVWVNRATPNITVSGVAPVAPATNDVWVDTS